MLSRLLQTLDRMRRLRPGATAAVLIALLVSPAVAWAHPLFRQHHDRTVLVRLTETGVVVEYTLALDHWTLLSDLVPFRDEIDPAQGPKHLYREFARLYGPRVAEGLLLEVDGRELKLRYAGKHDFKEEDHLRYRFVVEAAWPKAARSQTRLKITDSNFTLDPGTFRIAVQPGPGVTIVESTAAADPEKVKPIPLSELDARQAEKVRTAEALFLIAPPGNDAAIQVRTSLDWSVRVESEPAGFWAVLRSLDARRLLDSNLGIGLVLTLAFILGAIHSLQPGHGKTLVAAYLVGEQGTIGHAFFLGLVTTLTHTGVVFLLAIIVPLFWPGTQGEIAFGLALGSGILVMLISVWLVLRRLGGQAGHVHLFGGHHHHHGPDGHHHHLPADNGGRVRWWALASLGITGGIVPCGEAVFLLTTSWFILKQPWVGLPVTLFFSLGLASVLVLLGVLTVKFKRFASSRWSEGRLVRLLPVLSPVLTLLLGLWMCHEALSQRAEARKARHAERPIVHQFGGADIRVCLFLPGQTGMSAPPNVQTDPLPKGPCLASPDRI